MSDDVWQVGDPAPGTKRSFLGALDPLVGTPRAQPVDLADFLLARIAEDEAVAKAAADAESGEMYERRLVGAEWASRRGLVHAAADPDLKLWDNEGADSLEMAPPVAVHIARHDPARVLAECDAKREMVEDLRDELANQYDPEPTTLQLAERTLLTLALPYAGHPDYRVEWRP